jgi:hypothetical protein
MSHHERSVADYLVILVFLLCIIAMALESREITHLKAVIADKNVYIDAGCHGRYEGQE